MAPDLASCSERFAKVQEVFRAHGFGEDALLSVGELRQLLLEIGTSDEQLRQLRLQSEGRMVCVDALLRWIFRQSSRMDFFEDEAQLSDLVAEHLDSEGASGILRRCERTFAELDANGNGSLCPRELENLSRWVFEQFGRSFASEAAKKEAVDRQVRRFLELQPDGGEWTFSTFSDYFHERLEAAERYRLKRDEAFKKGYDKSAAAAKFRELDANSNGYLEGPEILQLADWMLQRCHVEGTLSDEQRRAEAARLLEDLDQRQGNNDGRFAFAEVDFYMNQRIDQVQQWRKRLEERQERQHAVEALTELQLDSRCPIDAMMAKVSDKFHEFDKSGDGLLQPAELAGLARWVFAEFGRSFKDEQEREKSVQLQVSRMLQKTGGGDWTFQTFKDYFTGMLEASERYRQRRNEAFAQGYQHSAAATKFKELDQDGNGYLEGAEILEFAEWVFRSFRPGGKELSEEQRQAEARKLLARLDERRGDSDGRLSFAEVDFYIAEKIREAEAMRERLASKAAQSAVADIVTRTRANSGKLQA